MCCTEVADGALFDGSINRGDSVNTDVIPLGHLCFGLPCSAALGRRCSALLMAAARAGRRGDMLVARSLSLWRILLALMRMRFEFCLRNMLLLLGPVGRRRAVSLMAALRARGRRDIFACSDNGCSVNAGVRRICMVGEAC